MGEMLCEGAHVCFTMEPGKAILAGTYKVIIDMSARFGRLMPHVLGVPDDDGVLRQDRGIRWHWGSYPKNTEGCTLTGETESMDFLGHTVDEFNALFVQLQNTLAMDEVYVTYQDVAA